MVEPRKVLNAAMTERELFECVRAHLNAFGWLWHHVYDARRSNAGLPDLIAVKNGRLLFIELKTEKGRLTDEQRVWLMALHHAGGEEGTPYGARTCVWRPSDLSSGVIESVLRGVSG